MRHLKKKVTLDRKSAARFALLRTLMFSLLMHRKIKTTLAKARYLQREIARVLTLAKSGDTVAHRRRALQILNNREIMTLLFKDIAPKLKDRKGGYTRITKIGPRKGDAAEVALIELLV